MKLIHQQANHYYRRFPHATKEDYEDLVECGRVTYYKTAMIFRPDRAKFITIFHLCLRQAMSGELHRQYRAMRGGMLSDLGEAINEVPAATEVNWPCIMEMFYTHLSRQAYLWVRAVLQPAKDFLDWQELNYRNVATCPRWAGARAFRYLRYGGSLKQSIRREVARALSKGATA